MLNNLGSDKERIKWVALLNIMVKTYDLRTKDEKALSEELAKLKAELAKARIGKVAAAATQVKASKIHVCLHRDYAIGAAKGYRKNSHSD